MPGSILCSVLEAVDLPPAAEDGDFVSVKVSIGKMEFQTSPSKINGGKTTAWNENFTFPVLNLRDNLVVAIIGSKSEEISQNEVDTPSIVEQGFCDKYLRLKRGGSVHLRISFILTDEERQRIEMMRAAALKRKEQGVVRSFSTRQTTQSVEEFGKRSTLMTRTMSDSTIEETGRANTERLLAGCTGQAVEGTEPKGEGAVDAVREHMILEEILESPEKSDGKSLPPNSVKDRVMALEKSLSQDSGNFGEMLSLQDKIEDTESDLLCKATAEQFKGRDSRAIVRGGENKNANSKFLLDVAKEVFRGAVMGAVMFTAAILIWRTSITQKRQRKK